MFQKKDDLLDDQDVPQPFVEEPQPNVEEAHASVLPGAEEQQDLVQPVVDEQTLTDDQFQFLMANGFVEPPPTYLDITTVLTWRGGVGRLMDRFVRLVPISDHVTTLRSSLQEIFSCCTTAAISGARMIRMTLIQAQVHFLSFNCMYVENERCFRN